MIRKEPEGLTLTKMTAFGRNFVKYGVSVLILLMVGRVAVTAFAAYWVATHPPAPPEPTAGFGSLPPIAFPAQTSEDKPTSYTLETPTGTLPSFGDRVTVFLMTKGSPSLLDNENAQAIAKRYGFEDAPSILDSNTYRWTKNQPLVATLDMDIIDHNLTYETDFLNRPELLLQTELPTDFDAVEQVKRFLSRADLLPGDIATSSGKIMYLKALGGALKPAVSVSDADFVQVDINRIPINGLYEFYSKDGKTGAVHAILAGKQSENILRLSLQHYPIEYSLSQTYYIRSTQSAWQRLQAGEGYIANKGTTSSAVIRSVELGYYESEEFSQYVQPIFVFKGDGDFIGYVSAIDPRYILQTGKK
ncbi:hypothetical protein KA082_02160 [Candidatus Woesebacteria bacterium]|nr:hypothetical protein [Candidatus Woesebacteria bacterium]